tara:strand:- start:457 stop:867 length:411 start_codon:yes stop_codon:yes gene_type:complete
MKVTRRQLKKLITEVINNEKCKKIDIKVDDIPLNVELANTEELRRKGLMNRTHLGQDDGMLFIHDTPDICGYYMKNTHIPLSIAYADEDGYIFQIEDMTPHDTRNVMSIQPVLYALEMNKNWFRKNNINIGNRIIL